MGKETHMTEQQTEPMNAEIAEILGRINQLKVAINTSARIDVSILLIKIHKDLYHKPESFAVLTDEEISVIIKGIEIHTSREILSGKERPRAKKSFSNDDLDLDL